MNIPVELYSAARDHRPKFRLLHAKDESPIHYERVCQTEGKPVAWEDLVKGYEYEKGQFVVLTKEDFKTAAVEKTKTIDILDFVDPKEVDERYFETPYYLQPGKGADRAYALLRDAIGVRERSASGRSSCASAAPRRGRDIGDAMVLTMMRFADELADLDDFKSPEAVRSARRDEDGAPADRQPEPPMGAGEIHGRVPGQPDAGDQGEDEGQKPKLQERETPQRRRSST